MVKIQSGQLAEQIKLTEQQLAVLDLQRKELEHSLAQRAAEADKRLRAQAANVYMTTEATPRERVLSPGGILMVGNVQVTVSVTIHNTSQQPIYDLRLHWVALELSSQSGSEELFGTLGPGGSKRGGRRLEAEIAPEKFVPIAYFRDSAGERWTLDLDGNLADVPAGLAAGAPLVAIGAAARYAAAAESVG